MNTNRPKTRIFNKETDAEEIDFPDFFYFDLTMWINKNDMTETEKKDNPSYKTTGGYLKSYDYHESWRISWNRASEEDRKKCLDLPNWDNEIFKEISGIDVEKELSISPTITIEGVEYDRKELKPIK